jgi:hypothetical protein
VRLQRAPGTRDLDNWIEALVGVLPSTRCQVQSGSRSDALAFKSIDARRFEVVFLPPQRQNVSTVFKSMKSTGGEASMVDEQSVVYDPEELTLLGQILDHAIEALPAAMQTAYNRTEIAKTLLACAATGQRDPIELQLATRIDLKVSVAA